MQKMLTDFFQQLSLESCFDGAAKEFSLRRWDIYLISLASTQAHRLRIVVIVKSFIRSDQLKCSRTQRQHVERLMKKRCDDIQESVEKRLVTKNDMSTEMMKS